MLDSGWGGGRFGQLLGLKYARENRCRPSGTGSVLPLYPALKRWAKFVRPSGAKVLGLAFRWIVRNLVLTYTLNPLKKSV